MSKLTIQNYIEEISEQLISYAEQIWHNPELAFNEYFAKDLYTKVLIENDFNIVQFDKYPTAFLAKYGHGKAVVTLMAEYDALPELGHACGHNLSGIMSLGAALSIKKYLEENKIEASIQIIGCPGEEKGGGKILLLEENAFELSDLAMMIHVLADEDMINVTTFARTIMDFTFIGKPAHAAACPEQGINALDAAVICLHAISALRQQSPMDTRFHGIITHGGDANNVIPAKTVVNYTVRAKNMQEMEYQKERIINCAKGAALATGCELKIDFPEPDYFDIKQNQVLLNCYADNLSYLGKKIPTKTELAGSTDAGNVSYKIPTIHPFIGLNYPVGIAVPHTKQFAEVCIGKRANEVLLEGAKLLALTTYDILTAPKLLEEIKLWHRENLVNKPNYS